MRYNEEAEMNGLMANSFEQNKNNMGSFENHNRPKLMDVLDERKSRESSLNSQLNNQNIHNN